MTKAIKPSRTHAAFSIKYMPTLTCESTWGNFGWIATCEVSQEELIILGNKGLLHILQRSPASNAEKELGDYEKRPENFLRSSIPYSEANGAVLAKHLGGAHEIDEDVAITPSIEVSFHEIGAGKEPVYKDEKALVAKHVAAGDFAQWMTDVIGYAATAADSEKVEVLRAIRAFLKAKLAEMLKTA